MRQMKLWMLATILTSCGLTALTSCSNEDNTIVTPTDETEAQLQRMTLREKVGQMFYVRPECLDTTIHFNRSGGIDQSVDDLTKIKLQAVNEMMRKVNENYPVGGIILYAHNIEDEAQLQRFIPEIRALKGSPLLCIDEEGGRVARIGRNSNFQVKTYESMGAITQQYTNGEAAVGCIKAGVDIVLGPQVFTEAFDAVVKAVEDGEITEQRINESVRRILKMKQSVRQSL